MTRHDDKVHLRHMLDHCKEALSMFAGKQRQYLKKDKCHREVINLVSNVPSLLITQLTLK
jgi:hypothetical protein